MTLPTDDRIATEAPATVRRLTGPQAAAIAVFELQGRQALEVAAEHLILRRHESLWSLPLHKVAFGHWQHAHKTTNDVDAALEDVVFCRTGSNVAELHTHGSVAVAESLFATFGQQGVCVAKPPEQTNATDLELEWSIPEVLRHLEPAWWGCGTERVPLARWDALIERLSAAGFPAAERQFVRWQNRAFAHLGRASASEVGRLLWAQVRGAWLLRLESIAEKWAVDGPSAIADLDALLATWSFGKFLSREIQVLVTGAPNVGKSSLINTLLGYQRNVVSDQPGTTRDLVGQATAIAGWQFRLVDSAGLRESDNTLEAEGIRRAAQATESVDLIVAVRAIDHPKAAPQIASPHVPIIAVLNKVDLAQEHLHSAAASAGEWAVSTVTGQGLQPLMVQMVEAVLPDLAGFLTTGRDRPPAVVFDSELWSGLLEWRTKMKSRPSEQAAW